MNLKEFLKRTLLIYVLYISCSITVLCVVMKCHCWAICCSYNSLSIQKIKVGTTGNSRCFQRGSDSCGGGSDSGGLFILSDSTTMGRKCRINSFDCCVNKTTNIRPPRLLSVGFGKTCVTRKLVNSRKPNSRIRLSECLEQLWYFDHYKSLNHFTITLITTFE